MAKKTRAKRVSARTKALRKLKPGEVALFKVKTRRGKREDGTRGTVGFSAQFNVNAEWSVLMDTRIWCASSRSGLASTSRTRWRASLTRTPGDRCRGLAPRASLVAARSQRRRRKRTASWASGLGKCSITGKSAG